MKFQNLDWTKQVEQCSYCLREFVVAVLIAGLKAAKPELKKIRQLNSGY